jgi:hypothetical protein
VAQFGRVPKQSRKELHMNRFLIAAFALSLLLSSASALADAEAQTETAPSDDPSSEIAASKADSRSARLDRFCPDATASRIKRQRGNCSAPGRVYTREDLDRTGASSINEALSRLDPSIGRSF